MTKAPAIPTSAAILADLEARGTEGFRKSYVKMGAGPKVFGTKMGDLRSISSP